MTSFGKILTSAAGLAMAVGAAAPVAAQSVPYGGYNPGYTNNNSVGAVINSILGGGRYGVYGHGNDRVAVDQCARATEARVSRDYRSNRYGQYPQNYNDPRNANHGYGYNGAGTARVVGITSVERRSNGLKVSGVIDSGMGYRGGYYGQGYDPRYQNQGYGNQGYASAAQADLRFTCRVDFRGYVSNIDIKRNVAQRRGY
ncbi:MAG: hypothetical protein ABI626_01520 [Sphingomicrobium sp.]